MSKVNFTYLPVSVGDLWGQDTNAKLKALADAVNALDDQLGNFRSTAAPVPAEDVSGLATVATSGSYTDLDDRPPVVMQIVPRVNGTYDDLDPDALRHHFIGSEPPAEGVAAERDLYTKTPEDFT